jgi:hypothetical protein
MEEWYQQQDFFTQARIDRITSWTKQEIIDLFA